MHYTPDNEARSNKRNELIALARAELGPLSEHAEIIIDRFASISAPQDPPIAMELILTKRGGQGGGRTRKPGNIQLNWSKLSRESPDLILTGAGSIATPWLIPLAAISIFNKLWAQATIELTKEQATCLFAMWHRCDESHEIDRDKAYESCSDLFSVYRWSGLTKDLFSQIIRDLESLRCVETRADNRLCLRERVHNSYL